MKRLAVVASHPVQYYAPLFRHLASLVDLSVHYCHRADETDQARAGFGVQFDWDVDLLSGYHYEFLENVSSKPELGRFGGVDTPEVSARLRAGGFDGVLILGWYLKSFLQALWGAKRAGIPVMVRGDSHLDTPRSRLKRLAKEALYPPFLRQFDAALIVGERNRAYWEHYGYPASRMFSSPHCVDTDWFAARATAAAAENLRDRLGISRDAPVALFAGKLIEFKRPTDVVMAAAHARSLGVPVELLVAGSGALEQPMRALASLLGVPLHMLGFCNQSQMPAVYAAADVLVLPSTGRETWGLVANEALACGTPVLLSDVVGCAPDLAVNGRVGRTFPVGDVESCGRHLTEMLRSLPSRAEIEQVSEKFSIAAAARGIITALEAGKARKQEAVSPAR